MLSDLNDAYSNGKNKTSILYIPTLLRKSKKKISTKTIWPRGGNLPIFCVKAWKKANITTPY